MLELDDCIRYVELVKENLDSLWFSDEIEKISEYYKTPKNTRVLGDMEDYANPLAFLLYQAEKSINVSRLNSQIGPSFELIKATILGTYLDILIKNNVHGVKEKINDIVKANKDEFEKIVFELDVAQSLVKLNHKVEFIPTRSGESKKTPDILADGKVEFECKKKDKLTKRDKQNYEHWEFLARKLTDMMNDFKKFYFVYLFFKNDPSSKSLKILLRIIRKTIQRNQEGSFDIEGVEIKISKICDYGQNFDLGIHGRTMPEIQKQIKPELFEKFIKTRISFPELLNYEKIQPDFDVIRHRLTHHSQDGKVAIGEVMKFVFKISEIPDRIKSVINSLEHAKNQLSGVRPGIICVNLTHISGKMIEVDFVALRNQIDKVLKNNSTISAVVLSSEYHFKENNSNRFLHKAIVIQNSSPKHEIPKEFQI